MSQFISSTFLLLFGSVFLRAVSGLDVPLYELEITRRVLNASALYQVAPDSRSPANFTVGIVGAGAAGLYSALLLESLGINCTIYEADDRIGGRILTHYFNDAAWNASKPGEPEYYDYVDLGAMRFPNSSFFARLIGNENNSVVSYVNSKTQGMDKVNLIPYILSTPNDVSLYQGVAQYNGQGESLAVLNSETPGDLRSYPGKKSITSSLLVDQLQDIIKSLNDSFNNGSFADAFAQVTALDHFSTRQFLREKGYTDADINIAETIADAGTGQWEFALSYEILDYFIVTGAAPSNWVTVEGGLSRLINGMAKALSKPILINQRVVKLDYASADNRTLRLSTDETSYEHDHVIATPPVGALQAIDLDGLDLDQTKIDAMREINMYPAAKVGMKFKSKWWQQLPHPHLGGESVTDLSIRQCVYPSYGINETGTGAMIASYTWGQDALRVGSYLDSLDSREDLTNITLRDLATLNNVTVDFLHDQLLDVVAWSWYDSPYAVGAFGTMGPGQLTTLWPSLLQPAAGGRLNFAGETLSTANSWVIGAVNSAYGAVARILAREGRTDLMEKLVRDWGAVNEVDMGLYSGGPNQVVTNSEMTS